MRLAHRRIIPTRVGTSCYNKLCPHCVGDHPHACGDKSLIFGMHSIIPGSSPRVWGQGRKTFCDNLRVRIIPTRVGTRSWESLIENKNVDHPHACGDKPCNTSLFICRTGSSPRVWGQASLTEFKVGLEGIIPTRVGTRTCTDWELLQEQDHPHACGDKQLLKIGVCVKRGSSPRVWGQDTGTQKNTSTDRIIPTRVGTSFRTDNTLRKV